MDAELGGSVSWFRMIYLASLVTYTFGALTFSVLSLFYWRGRKRARSPAFAWFTAACAAAFVINLPLRGATAVGLEAPWVTGLSIALGIATGLLPPLLLHVVVSEELPLNRAWRWFLAVFYTACTGIVALQGLDEAEIISISSGDRMQDTPAIALAVAAAAGLLAQMLSPREVTHADRRHRAWKRIILALMLLCSLSSTFPPLAWVSLFPDYLVLGFFCVTLYYQERLVFFDLLIKRGAFFAVALFLLIAFFAIVPTALVGQSVIGALLLVPLWLVSPWIYDKLASTIDRAWLDRPYPAPEAERKFLQDIQAAATEQDLRGIACTSLGEIFQAQASLELGSSSVAAPEGSMAAELQPSGLMMLAPRPNGVPYLSDDLRLLQSLSRTLGVVVENVRFREGEQKLRWLAGRAELKALRAQINPHFLFNALNAIAGLIQDHPTLADETVEHLAHVFRYTLTKSETEWVRLEEELEFVAAYLRVEKVRFGARLCIHYDLDPSAADVSVPAISIQPLIENAIKHGISVIDAGGTIAIRTSLGDALIIEITNSGPGFPAGFNATESSGHGLRNIMERLSGYFGESAQLSWSNIDSGARVLMRIPVTSSGHAGARQAVS